MKKLCFCLEHIAFIRQHHHAIKPDPVQIALLAELSNLHMIGAYMSEHKIHIQERDVYILRQTIGTKLNLIIPLSQNSIRFALDLSPSLVTFVEQKPDDKLSVQGINVRGREQDIAKLLTPLHEHKISTSLFIDPDPRQLKAAARLGITAVELNTYYYAKAHGSTIQEELDRIHDTAFAAHKFDFFVHAGGGLNYDNLHAIAQIEHINQFSIGYSIVARALATGIEKAITDMNILLT